MDDVKSVLEGLLARPSMLAELELDWRRQLLPSRLSILSLCEVLPGTVWALGVQREALRSRERRSTETLLLSYRRGQWRAVGTFRHRPVLALEKGEDGTIYAAGQGACYWFDGGRWHDLEAPEVVIQRLWAPSRSEIYAIGSGALFFFDGHRCHQVDLVRAYGAEAHAWCFGAPALADVHGSRNGEVWVVGTWFTHSTVLKGRKLHWRPTDCPSWYLYRVHALDGDEAIAVGGDGVFIWCGSSWDWVAPTGRSTAMPRAFFPHMVTRCDGVPLITGFSVLEDPPQICLWAPDRWYRAGPRVPLEQLTQNTASLVTSERELIVADFGATWHAPFPDPAELVTVDPERSLARRLDSIDEVFGEEAGTNVGGLWEDEKTIPDARFLDLFRTDDEDLDL